MKITKDEESKLDVATVRCVSDLLKGRRYYKNSDYSQGDANYRQVIKSILEILDMRKS